MPLELGLWRVDAGLRRLAASKAPSERWLEDALESDPSLLALDLLVVGRQVTTSYGKRIDLLALDGEGVVYLVELKRDRTPRDVVAQALDYGSWLRELGYEDLREIYRLHSGGEELEVGFEERFGFSPPDSLNEEHRLLVVASDIDPSTERIVSYLSEGFGVPINVISFAHFEDEGRNYLARTWLIDPIEAEARSETRAKRTRAPWNGLDFYVAFGEGKHRNWEDAVRYGFVSAGGGVWYSRTLESLYPGARVFVHIPKRGYVGVGRVVDGVVPIAEFTVDVDGNSVSLLELPLKSGVQNLTYLDDPNRTEYLVRVEWLASRPREDAIWEKGMFANQNSACPMRSQFTLDRLTEAFQLND
jgi:hypothetical protein